MPLPKHVDNNHSLSFVLFWKLPGTKRRSRSKCKAADGCGNHGVASVQVGARTMSGWGRAICRKCMERCMIPFMAAGLSTTIPLGAPWMPGGAVYWSSH